MSSTKKESQFVVSLGQKSKSVAIIGPAIDSSFEIAESEWRDEYPLGGDNLEGVTVWDIGAGYGEFAAQCHLLGAKKVICFEPNGDTFKYLVRNLGKLPNVEVHQKAVFSKPGKTILFARQSGTASGSILEVQYDPDHPSAQDREQQQVEMVGIAELLLSAPGPCLVKIDAEGVEYEIVRIAVEQRVLEECKTLFIEYHAGVQDIASLLESQGFDCEIFQKDSQMGIVIARREPKSD